MNLKLKIKKNVMKQIFFCQRNSLELDIIHYFNFWETEEECQCGLHNNNLSQPGSGDTPLIPALWEAEAGGSL